MFKIASVILSILNEILRMHRDYKYRKQAERDVLLEIRRKTLETKESYDGIRKEDPPVSKSDILDRM